MRVYGSSPLYNYVELIFRSKRMFIASIVLATTATIAVAAARTGSYNAQALVYLTGADQANPTISDPSQKGSIQYKLNLLNVTTKDPKFIRDAFKDAGLNRGMTDEQFDDFCKKARSALSFGSGNNVLEINCRWPDARAADIINGFFSAFSRRVLDEETATSHIATDTMVNRLQEYTHKQQEIEKKVIAYKEAHLGDMPGSFESEVSAIQQQKERIEAVQSALNTGKMQLTEVQRQLEGTTQTVQDIRENTSMNAALDNLEGQKGELVGKIADLKSKYTDNDPRVKAAEQQLDNLDAAIKAAKKNGSAADTEGGRTRVREVQNPQWVRLQQEASDLDIQVQALAGNLNDARSVLQQLEAKARHDPHELQKYEWMTKDFNLYTEIRDNLRARLEQARINEKQDREMHLAEMHMIVTPTSELEVVATKNMIFYAAGPLLGLIIAFAFSLLAESLDHSLRTPIEVEKYLGKPVLAVLPRMETPKDAAQRRLAGGNDTRPTLPS
jgi:uncharacterized protein involved in exopolysaccharide biosynthesis